jgi:cytochrome c
MHTLKTVIAASLMSPVLATAGLAADGDATAGEKHFNQCKTCHSIVADDGAEIMKGGKVGPNLWGVAGRSAGTEDGFRYSDAMVAAGEAGLAWNQDDFTTYIQDPTKFLRAYTQDDKARGKMTFKLRKAEQAPDLWAYLVSVGPGS